MKTNSGIDHVARIVGGDGLGETGVATAATATTLTTNSTRTAVSNDLAGHIVVTTAAAVAIGRVISNTSGANTVLTVDMWTAPNLAGSTTPDTPATAPTNTTPYVILPGGHPAFYIGLTANVNAPGATDTMLATTAGGTTPAEIWNSGGGLNRQKAAYAHTNGTATYTITGSYTANGSDGASNSIQKAGIFVHAVPKVTGPTNGNTGAQPTSTTSGIMLYETAVPSPPTLVSGDSLTVTDTITIS